MDELKIVYKQNKPYGIRDSGGFLFFFVGISKYDGQEERYREEVEEQYKLADYLLRCLKSLAGKEEIANCKWCDDKGIYHSTGDNAAPTLCDHF